MGKMDQLFKESDVVDGHRRRDGGRIKQDQLIESDHFVEEVLTGSAEVKLVKPRMTLPVLVVGSRRSKEVPADLSDMTQSDQTEEKRKKRVTRRRREDMFVFRTKSEIDFIEDGYRWRKYGQMYVKNNPNPRSYCKCTNYKCTAKKRVERCAIDPSIVITKYVGRHCHETLTTPPVPVQGYHQKFHLLKSKM